MQLTWPRPLHEPAEVMPATPRLRKRNTQRHLSSECAHRRIGRRIATRTPLHTASAERSRSYVTHLIEDGWDALFVQNQVGNEHASTTSIYTCVSSDYRTRTLRTALDSTVKAALATAAPAAAAPATPTATGSP